MSLLSEVISELRDRRNIPDTRTIKPTYVPLLVALDTATVAGWIHECFQVGLTDCNQGRMEMAKAMQARVHWEDTH